MNSNIIAKPVFITAALLAYAFMPSKASADVLAGSYILDLGNQVYAVTLTWNTHPNDVSLVKSIGIRGIFAGPGYYYATNWSDIPLLYGKKRWNSWKKYSAYDHGYHAVNGRHRALFYDGQYDYDSTRADIYIN